MSSSNLSEVEVDEGAERTVVEYLRANPAMLSRHPELVAELEVPHVVGQAISLVEYQVTVLRQQNAELRGKIRALVANARDNEKLGQRIHRMTLELVVCDGPGDVFAALYQSIVDEFDADFAAVRVFVAPRSAADAGLAEFLGPDSGAEQVFAAALASDKPTCGRLPSEQLRHLFGDEADSIGSGALVPLQGTRPWGMLAIGSREPERYHPGMGTTFLRQLGEVVSRVLTPHLAAR